MNMETTTEEILNENDVKCIASDFSQQNRLELAEVTKVALGWFRTGNEHEISRAGLKQSILLSLLKNRFLG